MSNFRKFFRGAPIFWRILRRRAEANGAFCWRHIWIRWASRIWHRLYSTLWNAMGGCTAAVRATPKAARLQCSALSFEWSHPGDDRTKRRLCLPVWWMKRTHSPVLDRWCEKVFGLIWLLSGSLLDYAL